MLAEVRPAKRAISAERNKLRPDDRAVHDWYRFVLSYPPHLVREYVERFGLDASQNRAGPFLWHRHNAGGVQEARHR